MAGGRGCYNCGGCTSSFLVDITRSPPPSCRIRFLRSHPHYLLFFLPGYLSSDMCHLVGHQAAACPKAGTPTWLVYSLTPLVMIWNANFILFSLSLTRL